MTNFTKVFKLFKVFKYSVAELFILLEAWFIFLKWDLIISFTQYDNWRSEISKLTSENHPVKEIELTSFEQTKRIKQIIQLSEVAGRFHLRKMNCLRRCLSQQKMLSKRGFNACMHIGVDIEEGKLKAHAWLTFQGKIINDSPEVLIQYSELKMANEHAILSALK